MAELMLYNTLTRRKERLEPLALHPETGLPLVRMYVCGPTVYDYAHIGNARPVIVFDVLFRLLRHLYGEDHVVYARNITDVDDKINDRAARDYPDLPLNEAIRKVTEGTNAQFQADVEALGCLEPTDQPRATEHIDGMRALIDRLIARGFAYVAENHVLFSPAAMDAAKGRLPRYGALANRSLDEMIAGARVDVAPYKRDATDFVLWKPSKPNEPGWESPAGIPVPGRPGWHIECSAMSMAKLLEPYGGGLACDDPLKNTFDIHGGGIDLVFPHHENEIAQSCCAFGAERMASIWMHNGFLQVEGQKMSKSLGNFFTINELLATESFGGRRWTGDVLRFAMLKTHYRQPIDWTEQSLIEGTAELLKWAKISESAPKWEEHRDDYVSPRATPYPAYKPSPEILEALSDDLNLPGVLFVLRKHYRRAATDGVTREDVIFAQDAAYQLWVDCVFLGIDLTRFRSSELYLERRDLNEVYIDSLINARLAARAAKNWAESDRIRDELVALGIVLMDGKDEAGNPVTRWEVKR
ncbi:cysteine--tRNA ligase [Rhabdaerophilum sp. SD176]|uniref:cysteine--tRNA ligase n=1 Tax=Rhabdaerophilum sp. SD176 TaxID=2983548 RepID=UPI0024DF8F6F|nr:cysteine--tRNA ligase [Rhabdaerophilum sp. SD176]